MQIELHSPGRKIAFLGACFFLSAVYLSFCTRGFLAAYFSAQPDVTSLTKATSLEPATADYWHILARYHLFVAQEPASALPFLSSAIRLNPHRAEYWLDLANAYQLVGKPSERIAAIEKAIAADPTNPEIAWQAANLYWVEGKTNEALHEFRIVAENDTHLMGAAIERCWRIRPDVTALLSNVLPQRADIYSAFLEFLISRNEPAAAAFVWDRLAHLQTSVSTRYVFGYTRYLIEHRQVDQAKRVWRDSANLADLSDYQPSPANLVVNGDFSLPVLNAGFDWLYQSVPGVALAIDVTESHSAHQSLSVIFDSSGLEDAGIRQLIPVEPHTGYEFSAYFKSENLEGAGGPRFVLQDAATGSSLFSSDEIKGADFWKESGGTFTTGPDTNLLVLRLIRVPPNNAIRGKLWIDDVRLVKKQPSAGAQ
jgi:hypothetical protein